MGSTDDIPVYINRSKPLTYNAFDTVTFDNHAGACLADNKQGIRGLHPPDVAVNTIPTICDVVAKCLSSELVHIGT